MAMATPRRPIPLILESFPSPPTFIPPSPITPNPPPSLPPSLPLPPVPGPSPIPHQFLSTPRSNRTSNHTLSSDSRRNSSASLAVPLPFPTNKRESIASIRSLRNLNYIPNPPIADRPFSISEEDASDVIALLRRSTASLLPPQLDRDEEEVEKVLDYYHTATARLAPSPMPPIPSDRANESISSIDMRDLPDDDIDIDIDIRHTHATRPPPLTRTRISKPRTDTVTPAASRSPSPDIKHILSTMPRPSRSRSSLRKQPSSTLKPPPLPSDALDWQDDSFISDYGTPLPRRDFPSTSTNTLYPFLADDPLDAEAEARLERQLEGLESDSDSSLDLHTPLPTLMLRHGHLSPHSKILPRSDPDARPGSTYTLASSKALKDERDTPKRRNRHRDQRLLRGGIGLTTGLGWSDSEDEDAPSALTRRISSLNLSRQSSFASVHSSMTKVRMTRSTRSLSASTSATGWGDDDIASVSTPTSTGASTSTRTPRTSMPPPTSWQGRSSRVSIGSATGSTTGTTTTNANANNRTSVGSARSSLSSSLSVSIPDRFGGGVPGMSRASSTASSVGVLTPGDGEFSPRVGALLGDGKGLDVGKSLPPLPPPVSAPRARVGSLTERTVTRTPRVLQLATKTTVKPRHSDSSVALGTSTTNTTATSMSTTTKNANAKATSVEDAPPPVKPRPRIGTGMPYRTASYSSLGSTQSRMRLAGGGGVGVGGSGLPRMPVAPPRVVAV